MDALHSALFPGILAIPVTEHRRYRSANPTFPSGHSGKDLEKPWGVDHPEINFHW